MAQTTTLSREELVLLLVGKFPELNCMLTEDFFGLGGTMNGIWLSGEDGITDKKGNVLFNYYNNGSTYKFGVINHFCEFIEKHGWYAEWYDAGTLMLWEN